MVRYLYMGRLMEELLGIRLRWIRLAGLIS